VKPLCSIRGLAGLYLFVQVIATFSVENSKMKLRHYVTIGWGEYRALHFQSSSLLHTSCILHFYRENKKRSMHGEFNVFAFTGVFEQWEYSRQTGFKGTVSPDIVFILEVS
jgi:hypothetical protein